MKINLSLISLGLSSILKTTTSNSSVWEDFFTRSSLTFRESQKRRWGTCLPEASLLPQGAHRSVGQKKILAHYPKSSPCDRKKYQLKNLSSRALPFTSGQRPVIPKIGELCLHTPTHFLLSFHLSAAMYMVLYKK